MMINFIYDHLAALDPLYLWTIFGLVMAGALVLMLEILRGGKK